MEWRTVTVGRNDGTKNTARSHICQSTKPASIGRIRCVYVFLQYVKVLLYRSDYQGTLSPLERAKGMWIHDRPARFYFRKEIQRPPSTPDRSRVRVETHLSVL